jgi:hypothetical protein
MPSKLWNMRLEHPKSRIHTAEIWRSSHFPEGAQIYRVFSAPSQTYPVTYFNGVVCFWFCILRAIVRVIALCFDMSAHLAVFVTDLGLSYWFFGNTHATKVAKNADAQKIFVEALDNSRLLWFAWTSRLMSSCRWATNTLEKCSNRLCHLISYDVESGNILLGVFRMAACFAWFSLGAHDPRWQTAWEFASWRLTNLLVLGTVNRPQMWWFLQFSHYKINFFLKAEISFTKKLFETHAEGCRLQVVELLASRRGIGVQKALSHLFGFHVGFTW